MLFVTNRTPKESIRTKTNRPISFDMNNNTCANSVYYCRRDGKEKYTEVGGFNFMQEVKEHAAEQVLFYIHGFSNLPEDDVFKRTRALQDLFDQTEPGMVLVIPLIWPCDNDFGIIKDYWDDQKSADQSAFAFSRVLQHFMTWKTKEEEAVKKDPDHKICYKRINVLAHSMGNRVLRETIWAWNKYDLPHGVPKLFRTTFMVAADVVNECLEPRKTGDMICHASRSVVVYHASDDLALRSSKVSNLKNRIASRRLGHSGPENMDKVSSNVFSVDCDDFNNKYDMPAGHTYFMHDNKGKPGKVFLHMCETIKKGRVFPQDEFRRTTIL